MYFFKNMSHLRLTKYSKTAITKTVIAQSMIPLNSALASGDFCHLLITLDPYVFLKDFFEKVNSGKSQ